MRRLNWIHTPLLLGSPLLALYGVATTPLSLYTALFSIAYYAWSALGITAGYHRYFSHRAFDVIYPVRVLLLLMGSGAVQGSCRWWSRDHRAHHRYVDTSKDPYAVTNGFFYAHIGWMLVKQDPKVIGRASIKDLDEDPFIRFQHRFYGLFALVFGFLLPTVVCGLGWGDWRGGYFYAAVARLVFVHHSTFLVNSLAHYWGDEAFSDKHTAKNSIITAILTMGEGYHNFHHEFPADFRNAIMWYQYDPTKWFISALAYFGLAYNLKRFPRNEIDKGHIQMKQKKLDKEKEKINWGPDPDALPEFTMEEVQHEVKQNGKKWLVLSGFVLDLAEFESEHPGGPGYLRSEYGKDATEKFYGGVYDHSLAGGNLSTMYRIGRVLVSQQ